MILNSKINNNNSNNSNNNITNINNNINNSNSNNNSNNSSNSSNNSNNNININENIPLKNNNFIIRNCYNLLNELMISEIISPRIIIGKLGTGTSTIVNQYIYNIKENNNNNNNNNNKYNLIYWFKMDTNNIKNEWLKFASYLNIETNNLTLQEIIRIVYKRINQYRYLLVFDNVESFQFIQASLPNDTQAGQHIIITTQSEVFWPNDCGIVKVDNFNSEETISYINKYCRANRLEAIASEDSSLKLHDAMNGYPLAISLSLSYINQQSQSIKGILTIEKFLQLFQTKSLLEKYRQLTYGPLKLLFPLCDLISEAIKQQTELQSQQLSQPLQNIFEQICMLSDVSNISLSLFSILNSSSNHNNNNNNNNNITFNLPTSIDGNLLRPYFLYGLLTLTTSQSFSCHHLIQTILCEQNLYLDTSTAVVSKLSGFREDIIFERALFPLIKRFYTFITNEEKKHVDEEIQQCIQTASNIYLQIKYLQTILQFLERSGISSQYQYLLKKLKIMIFMILGSTLCRLGLYRDSLIQYQEVQNLINNNNNNNNNSPSSPTFNNNVLNLNDIIPFEIIIYKRLGIIYSYLQKYQDSISSLLTYSQLIQQTYGLTNEEYEESLILLGKVYYLSKKYNESREYYEQVLISQRTKYPEIHYKIALSLHSIASVFEAQEVYMEALLLFRESLSIKKKVYPLIHSETIKTLFEIGMIYEKQKKYSQALSQYEEVYMMIQKIYQDSHPIISKILDRLGMIHKLENRLQDSLEYLQQSYAIKKRIYCDNHVEIAQILHNIADIYKEQGKHNLALEWFQQTFNMKLMLYPEIHEEIAKTTFCIGTVYTSQGKYVQALESFTNCLNTQRHLLSSLTQNNNLSHNNNINGNNHNSHNNNGNISTLSSSPGLTSPSSSSTSLLLTTGRPTSPNNISTNNIINNNNNNNNEQNNMKNEISETLRQIGNIYQNQGRYIQALSSYEESLQLQKLLNIQRNVKIPQLMCQIGSVYKSQERYEEALEIYENSLQLQKEIYGTNHVEIATTLSNIATIYTSQGKYTESLNYLKQSLQVKKSIYLTTHQSIIVTEETIRRTENQKMLKEKILTRLNEYIENRLKESEMVSSSYSLGMIYSKDEKINAAKYLVKYVEETGLERLGELVHSPGYEQYEGPLSNGRLGQLVKSILDEIYARENMIQSGNNGNRLRGSTI